MRRFPLKLFSFYKINHTFIISLAKIDPELVEKLRSPLQYASSTESEEEEPIIYGDVDQSVAFLGSDDECLEDVSAEDPLKSVKIILIRLCCCFFVFENKLFQLYV